MMNDNYRQRWQIAYSTMRRFKPQVEKRARSVAGSYRVNLAREWRLLLMREVLA